MEGAPAPPTTYSRQRPALARQRYRMPGCLSPAGLFLQTISAVPPWPEVP
jgi:hypothetical protein